MHILVPHLTERECSVYLSLIHLKKISNISAVSYFPSHCVSKCVCFPSVFSFWPFVFQSHTSLDC